MAFYFKPLGLLARGLQTHTWGRPEKLGDQPPKKNPQWVVKGPWFLSLSLKGQCVPCDLEASKEAWAPGASPVTLWLKCPLFPFLSPALTALVPHCSSTNKLFAPKSLFQDLLLGEIRQRPCFTRKELYNKCSTSWEFMKLSLRGFSMMSKLQG